MEFLGIQFDTNIFLLKGIICGMIGISILMLIMYLFIMWDLKNIKDALATDSAAGSKNE